MCHFGRKERILGFEQIGLGLVQPEIGLDGASTVGDPNKAGRGLRRFVARRLAGGEVGPSVAVTELLPNEVPARALNRLASRSVDDEGPELTACNQRVVCEIPNCVFAGALHVEGAGHLTNVEVDDAYRCYASRVLRRCRRILRDDAAAQDALQEAFLRFWRYGQTLRISESRLTWLYRVAERCCFDQLAQGRRRSEAELGGGEEQQDASFAARDVEDRQLALRFLDRFDDRVKAIVVLYYLDEMTQEEIANVVGWSRQTVFKKITLVRNDAETFRADVERA